MALVLLSAVLWLANVFFGSVGFNAGEVYDSLFTPEAADATVAFIVRSVRVPQACTALLAGGALAVSGLMLQTLFRNPLAGPSILGVSSGANLGVAVVMLLTGGTITAGQWSIGGHGAVVAAALVGSFTVMAALMALSTAIRDHLALLIAGIMVGYLASSGVSLLSTLTTAQGIQGYVMWGMGSFGDVSPSSMPWFAGCICAGLLLSFALAKPLNLLLLGEGYASNLGVRVRTVRNLLLLATGVLTGVVTAYCGPVAFVGMAVPHIARGWSGTDNHFVLIPSTMLWGGIMTLACNLASTLPSHAVLPVNALTALVGVPVILFVILKGRP